MEIQIQQVNLYRITKNGSSVVLTIEELEKAFNYANEKVTYVQSADELELDSHIWEVNSANAITKYRVVSDVRTEDNVPCIDAIRYIEGNKPYPVLLTLDKKLAKNGRSKLFKEEKLAQDYVANNISLR